MNVESVMVAAVIHATMFQAVSHAAVEVVLSWRVMKSPANVNIT